SCARRAAARDRRMALLIDTSILVDIERAGALLEASVGDAERAMSVITVSELLHGGHRAKDPAVAARRLAFVEALLATIAPLPMLKAWSASSLPPQLPWSLPPRARRSAASAGAIRTTRAPA